MLSVCVCMYVWMSTAGVFFWEHLQLSTLEQGILWAISLGVFFRIFEIFIFGRFIAKKGSKLTPKRTFSLNPTAFFSGKGHILFGD